MDEGLESKRSQLEDWHADVLRLRDLLGLTAPGAAIAPVPGDASRGVDQDLLSRLAEAVERANIDLRGMVEQEQRARRAGIEQ